MFENPSIILVERLGIAKSTCDYVVIGAGATGSVLAARLSEDDDNRVVVIEAGGSDRRLTLQIPGLVFLASRNKKLTWSFATEPGTTLDGRRSEWIQGKVVGGSSSINGMIYTRGHSLEYDAWRDDGCETWGFTDVLPYFKKAESNFRGRSHWHGDSGPIHVKKSISDLPICDAFLNAVAGAGFPVVDDLNCDIVDGFGYFDVNIHQGRRASVSAAYLHPTCGRKNLTVLTHAEALRIVIEGGRARGVEIAHEGQQKTVWAEREIILCAGAIKSPHLLLLSGIGPARDLAKHGIPVIVDSPQVGKNLQNHPSYALEWLCSELVTAYKYVRPMAALRSGLEYALYRKGVLAETVFAVGGFFRSDDRFHIPDIHVILVPSFMPQPSKSRYSLSHLLPTENGFAILVVLGKPHSRGEVTLASANPADQPLIIPRYLSDSRDMMSLITAVQRMRDAMRDTAMQRLIRSEKAPGSGVAGRGSLGNNIRENIRSAYHQSGTCAMGSGPSAVLDPELRVRGVEGLRVADTSIMPYVPNATLHGPAIMIGEKAAAMIQLEKRS